MFLVAFGIALVGYSLFPTAPPRFLPEWGFIDSVAQFTGVPQDSVAVDALFNPYAAVPSMHVGFALMIGWPLARLVRHRALKVFWATYPLIVTFVIVATANHFLADAFLGAVTAGLGALAARWLARVRPAAWSFGPRLGAARTRLMTTPLISPERRAVYRNRLIESRLTPNAISLTGLVLNVVAAVLIWQEEFILGGIAFIVGSVCDTLDGRYSRMSGKGTPFGAFLDSTLDRIEEGVVLTAIAVVFVDDGDKLATAAVGRRRARIPAGLVHSGPRRGAGRRVQGRDREPRGPGRDPLHRDPARRRRSPRVRRLRARGARARSPCSSASSTCAGSSRRPCNRAVAEGSFPPDRESTRNHMSTNGNGKSNGHGSNGHGARQQDKVRVAIIGVGNCASAFVQGVEFYKDADPSQDVPGLMHVDLGGYHVRDIEFSAAFDIDADKVGKDLGEAIWSGQNNTIEFAKVGKIGVPVHRGMTHDGLGKYLKQRITKAPGETADIVQILKDTKTDVVVSYLPVGSEDATKWYVEQILEAGCGFVNCIPVFIAREPYWNKRFAKAGLPIVGDDIKSQVGATIVHRTLARLFHERGVRMQRTSQLNVGGNMDFFNMLERERLESKKISKTNAVTSIMGHELPPDDVYIGPSDYVPWLTDRKWAHIRVEGQAFGDVPLNLELKLEVWDSPNSAGIVIDAVRCCKLALNEGVGGQLDGPSSYLMKSPYSQRPDHLAREATEQFIAEHSRTRTAADKAVAAAQRAAVEGSGTAH